MKKITLRSFMVSIILLFASTITNHAEIISITTIDQLNNTIKQSTQPVIIRFHARWCSACKKMEQIFTELADQYANQYTFADVDVDQYGSIASKFQIKGVPVFLFFKNHQQIDKLEGIISQEVFEEKINANFGE